MADGMFSLVVAAYNVEKYLDRFFLSLEGQTYPMADLEVIVVDDGSTDSTLEIARRWESRYRNIRIITKENGGAASARNSGLAHATHRWITFADSDDMLDPEYFARMAEFIARDTRGEAAMLASRSLILHDASGRVTESHPLDWKFWHGDRLVSLEREPQFVHLGGHSTFVRRDVVQQRGITFDDRIQPSFEDADFNGRYLATFDEPVIGYVASARYLYRKREDKTSLIDTVWQKPEKMDDEIRYGHIGMMSAIRETHGSVPKWAQNMALYSLLWYFRTDEKLDSPTTWVRGERLQVLHELLREAFSMIDSSTIEQFGMIHVGWNMRQSLLNYYKGANRPPRVAIIWETKDADQGLMKISYTYSGDLPEETLQIDGVDAEPVFAKTIVHLRFGAAMLNERSLVVPISNNVDLTLDGVPVRMVAPPPAVRRPRPLQYQPEHLRLAPASGQQASPPGGRPGSGRSGPAAARIAGGVARSALGTVAQRSATLGKRVRDESVTLGKNRAAVAANVIGRNLGHSGRRARNRVQHRLDRMVVKAAGSDLYRGRFRDAWVLMDRTNQADDNAEHLYRYLAQNRPEVNAWFLLERSSPDWQRLSSEGFRLVEYGSAEAVALLKNASYMISSHADVHVQDPIGKRRFGGFGAKQVFLQHGITMNDISQWLNSKNLALMVTATPEEYCSISGDRSPYKFSPKEVRLTGFPRHDALLAKAQKAPVEERDILLIAPTWRKPLAALVAAAATQSEALSLFAETEYCARWLELLRSERLERISRESGKRVVLLAHPSLDQFFGQLDLPAHITVTRYSEVSVQDLLCESAVLVTDYSSINCDAAYAGGNVLYYQFDAEDMFSGAHIFRPSYFGYDTHGYGPVTRDAEGALGELAKMADAGFERDATYSKRAEAAFSMRDGRCCERVATEIELLRAPWKERAALSPASRIECASQTWAGGR